MLWAVPLPHRRSRGAKRDHHLSSAEMQDPGEARTERSWPVGPRLMSNIGQARKSAAEIARSLLLTRGVVPEREEGGAFCTIPPQQAPANTLISGLGGYIRQGEI